MSWVVYVLALSALLTAAAWGAERVLLALRLPSRWVWIGAMATTCVMVSLAWSGALSPDAALPDNAGTVSAMASSLEEDSAGAAAPLASRTPASVGATLLAILNPAGVPAAFLNRGLNRIGDALEARWAGVGIGMGLWLAGSLLLLAALATGWLRLGRSRRFWLRTSLLGHTVRISSGLGPAVVGIRKPEIVLPNSTLRLAESKLRMVLLHEQEHVSAGDTRLLAGGLVPLVLFPWNPFLWLQHARLREAVEVDCDMRVLGSGIPARSYAGTLIDIGGDRFPGLSPSPALGRPGRVLERRIRSMKPRTRIQRIPAGIAGAALALTFLILACEVDTPTVEHQSAAEAEEASLQTSDQPGAAASVRLRGRTSVRGESAPLIVIDGIVQTSSTIDIDASDIESIEVMKGEAATEHYGERAGAGVILITTVDATEPPSAPREVGPANVDGATVVEPQDAPESGFSVNRIERTELPPPEATDADAERHERATVDATQTERALAELAEVLQAQRIPGAQVQSGEGDGTVRMRGNTSVSASGDPPRVFVDGIIQSGGSEGIDSRTKARMDAVLSRGEPLVIVDGIVQTRGVEALEALDRDDILEIEVVRGATGAETYGSRASDGIINITTRRN